MCSVKPLQETQRQSHPWQQEAALSLGPASMSGSPAELGLEKGISEGGSLKERGPSWTSEETRGQA